MAAHTLQNEVLAPKPIRAVGLVEELRPLVEAKGCDPDWVES